MPRKPGPRPMPTKLQVLHGEKRPSRVNATEPQPRAVALARPDWLPDEAVEVWDDIEPELAAMDMSFKCDSEVLATYAIFTVLKRRALALVDSSNVVLRGRDGNIVSNPAAREARALGMIALAYAREFGLTPSARRELGRAGGEADEGGAARLLS